MDTTTATTTATTAAQNAAAAQLTNKLSVKVTSVFFTKYEENQYYTLALRLNKALKVMKEGNDGLYSESTTQFLNKPAAAVLQDVTDDIASYYLAVKGINSATLSTALSGAEVTLTQRFFAAGETKDDVTNDTDHDQWFTFVTAIKISKMAKLVMSKELGLSIDELKLLLE